MNTLHFEKLSRFDRAAEPVTVSIPFAAGVLDDVSCLAVMDGDTRLPVQARALALWDDGTVKWALLNFQADLPGNDSKPLTFHIGDAHVPEPSERVSMKRIEGGLRVSTGPLELTVPEKGFHPIIDVMLDGRRLTHAFGGFAISSRGKTACSSGGAVELTVEEDGPLRAVITVRGRHILPDGSGFFGLAGRITAYAGKSYVEVEHKFIHDEEDSELALDEISLRMDAGGAVQNGLSIGEGYYGTSIRRSDDSVSHAITLETILYQSNEHFADCFYGDFWADHTGGDAGLAVSIHQAHQNFPKALEADRRGITVFLFRKDDGRALRLIRGMGKTHRLLLHFHGAEAPLEAISSRSLQFQLPDHPALCAEWYRRNNPWLENFFPERTPGKLITYLSKLHDGRPKALGMMHFGDAPDANYTDQGRGRGETVYVNNEYDRPHACMLFYALTGQRRVLDSALVSARHWLDVDFCHYDPDPLKDGGLRFHTAYHCTGGVAPSHQWTEGLLDYYFFTGRREALDVALSIGENILRHMEKPALKEAGATQVRESGWALRALVGLYLATGDDRWKEESSRIVQLLCDWFGNYEALLAPYTDHTMPRVPFMVNLTVNSLGRYLLIEDDERVRRLIVSVMDDMIGHCLGPDGIFFYKELPSLQRSSTLPHSLESLTLAYRLTGCERYLKTAVRQFAAAVQYAAPGGAGMDKRPDESGAVLVGRGRACRFAQDYTSLIIFAGEASDRGMLDWYEYPFEE